MTPGLPPLPAPVLLALADAVLLLHAAVVAFVVLGLPAIVLGNLAGGRWADLVNRRLWRGLHLLAIAVVAAQAWLGRLCPLTSLEMALREAAGAPAYGGSFVAHWVQALLYWALPPWVFVAAYSAFLAAVAWAWWRWPPAARPTGPQRRPGRTADGAARS
jgi:hypothetical protein